MAFFFGFFLICCGEMSAPHWPGRAPPKGNGEPTPIQKSQKRPDPISHGESKIHPLPSDPCMRALKTIEPVERDEALDRYYAGLPQTVIGARIVPVAYFSAPQRTQDPRALNTYHTLAQSRQVRRYIKKLLSKYQGDKPFLRRIFLSDGYFFESRPYLARAMVRGIHIEDLFDDPHIYLYRDGQTQILEQRDGTYFGNDGRPAKLLLNDRISNDRMDLLPPLHIDLGQIRRTTGALRTIPRIVGSETAWIDLIFPNGERRSAKVDLLRMRSQVTCIAGVSETLKELRSQARAFWWQHRKTTDTATKIVAERPRFDEPTDESEDDQEDGALRLAWIAAYRQREDTFKFREVEYRVFDRQGNPIPPQVCVDFVFDVWERAHGTWFNRRGEKPGRTSGEIDFSSIPGFARRNIPSILAFSEADDTPLDRYDIPRKHWIPLKRERRFAKVLAGHTDAIRDGDVLIIHGLREQDMREHYHAVLVLETDPLTGLPMVVADNQGRPRIGSLFNAMRAAPLRSIKHRIRIEFQAMKQYLRTVAREDT